MTGSACGHLRVRSTLQARQSARLTSRFPVRQFHAPWRPSSSPTYPDSAPETLILSAALPHVSEFGFSEQALARGARDAGFLPVSTSLFRRGAFELVHFHLVQQRLALAMLAASPESADLGSGTVADRLHRLVRVRLMANGNVGSRYAEAIALMSLAGNIPASLAELGRLADDLWYLAGDTTVDGRWYAKRAMLSGVYAASEVFMSRDQSHDYVETQDFLRRRLEDMHAIGSSADSTGQWLGFAASSSVNVLRSWGVRL